MTSYNDLSVHELLDICYSIVIDQSLDNRALLASYGTHTICLRAFYKVQVGDQPESQCSANSTRLHMTCYQSLEICKKNSRRNLAMVYCRDLQNWISLWSWPRDVTSARGAFSTRVLVRSRSVSGNSA